MIRTDIGEMVISVKKRGALSCKKNDYVFIPSFENLSRLGEPAEIISAYTVLLSNKSYEIMRRFKEPTDYIINYLLDEQLLQLKIAKLVLRCCCNDDITDLIGEKKEKRVDARAKYFFVS